MIAQITHLTAPSFFNSFFPFESRPFFFFEERSLLLIGLPVPIEDGGDTE